MGGMPPEEPDVPSAEADAEEEAEEEEDGRDEREQDGHARAPSGEKQDF